MIHDNPSEFRAINLRIDRHKLPPPQTVFANKANIGPQI